MLFLAAFAALREKLFFGSRPFAVTHLRREAREENLRQNMFSRRHWCEAFNIANYHNSSFFLLFDGVFELQHGKIKLYCRFAFICDQIIVKYFSNNLAAALHQSLLFLLVLYGR